MFRSLLVLANRMQQHCLTQIVLAEWTICCCLVWTVRGVGWLCVCVCVCVWTRKKFTNNLSSELESEYWAKSHPVLRTGIVAVLVTCLLKHQLFAASSSDDETSIVKREKKTKVGNPMVQRVSTLSFKRTAQQPRFLSYRCHPVCGEGTRPQWHPSRFQTMKLKAGVAAKVDYSSSSDEEANFRVSYKSSQTGVRLNSF